MIGVIIGDIVGSRFEFDNYKGKDFELFADGCEFTDDTIMTLAVGKALIESKDDIKILPKNTIDWMQKLGTEYPSSYGSRFASWLFEEEPLPYNSWGNGAAMRVCGCGLAGKTEEEVKFLSLAVTVVTHNHYEGLKGAEATALAVYFAKNGMLKEDIGSYITEHYYPLNFTLDEIRDSYTFDVSCQGTVPQAIEAFMESTDFESAIRNAVSIGGDSDTLAAITGGIAGAYYGVPATLRKKALSYLDKQLTGLLVEFEQMYEVRNTK